MIKNILENYGNAINMLNMDTESHLLLCKSYSKLRENLDFSLNKDLCKYLQKILVIRSKGEQNKINEQSDEPDKI